jgi:acetyl esterase
VSLWLRDHDGPRPLLQLLHQPMLDASCATPSMREFTQTPGFDSSSARFAWSSYLGDQRATAYARPACADSLRLLPPTHLTCSELDPLRDEGLGFAQRLVHAGVATDLRLIAGTCHGYDSLVSDAGVSARTVAEQVQALRAAFALGPKLTISCPRPGLSC